MYKSLLAVMGLAILSTGVHAETRPTYLGVGTVVCQNRQSRVVFDFDGSGHATVTDITPKGGYLDKFMTGSIIRVFKEERNRVFMHNDDTSLVVNKGPADFSSAAVFKDLTILELDCTTDLK